MQKVISIHLNGKSYQLEESGYEELRAYLADADRRLAGNPDRNEIVADLEQAVADKCRWKLSASKDIVTSDEMRQILREMGPVATEPDPQPESSSHSQQSDARTSSGAGDSAQRHKRLYLIREEAKIAGVCAGIAAYLGTDVALVRVLFVLLTIVTGGTWILVYLVLMLVVPYAKTAEERAAAYGRPFNAQEVVERAKEAYRNVAKQAEEWRK